ncbi:hypothetical protein FVF58_41005 [Paraburkholderia panacisoli]|uniref:Uncharacterized protein n=1 Tax=Paraburkholderia panacisoli TaxID=2603818 RepID=A0A5B0G9N4_9BURK|nr:hypothetical protein FVF58_41005 [Paraburkholderia panacisoli]
MRFLDYVVACRKSGTTSKDDMTHSMWGIALGLALMFGAALRRYRRNVLRKRDIRWLDEHHILDRLRTQLELSPRK